MAATPTPTPTQSQLLVNLSHGFSSQRFFIVFLIDIVSFSCFLLPCENSPPFSVSSNLRADTCVSSSFCETPRTNRSWALPGSLKLHKFRPQRVRRRGSPCLGSFENDGLLRNGIGDGDAVIIVDHGSRRRESNLMLEEFVKMFKDKTGYPIVEPAHMELAEPSIKSAFSSCVQQGAKRVVVSPFFLFPGRHWHQDIPSLTADAAKDFSGIAYLITAPLGLHNLLIDVVDHRIQHCLSHVEGDADECLVCAGTNKCKLYNSS